MKCTFIKLHLALEQNETDPRECHVRADDIIQVFVDANDLPVICVKTGVNTVEEIEIHEPVSEIMDKIKWYYQY